MSITKAYLRWMVDLFVYISFVRQQATGYTTEYIVRD